MSIILEQVRPNVSETVSPNFLLLQGIKNETRPLISDLLDIDRVRFKQVLESLRRTIGFLDGTRSISSPNFNINLFDRIEDIRTDFRATTDLEISPEEISETISRTAKLEFALFGLAKQKARSSSFDTMELEAKGENIIERLIWFNWRLNPEFSNEEEAENLIHYTLASLRHLDNENNDLRIDSWFDFIENEERTIFPIQNYWEKGNKVEELLEVWHLRSHKYSLNQVLPLIERLPNREKLSVLDRFGYIYPDLTMKERSVKYGISMVALRNGFISGLEKLIEMVDNDPNLVPNDNFSLVEIIEQLKTPEIISLNDEAVSFDSPRLAIMNIEETILPLLTDKERLVLSLAKTHSNGKLSYSLEEISVFSKLSVRQVSWIIKKIAELAKFQEERFISSDGKPVHENSAQHSLLLIWKRNLLPLKSFSSLSTREQQLFLALTSTDCEGRFKTTKELEEEFGTKYQNVLGDLLKTLENSDWVYDIEETLRKAIADFGQVFNETEKMVIKYVLFKIDKGLPIRSASRRTIGWKQICSELGLHRYFGRNLMKKISQSL